MDVDAVIRRAPELALVDELAHTNAPGMRNEKRYQDIDEILDAGIDVISTVNVQHLESLNDAIFELTERPRPRDVPRPHPRRGGRGRARRPHARGAAGAAARRARSTRRSAPRSRCRTSSAHENLAALRELALREVAEDVESAAAARPLEPLSQQAVAERVLALIEPQPKSQRIIRRAWRSAQRLGGEIDALWVRPPGREPTAEEQTQLAALRRVASMLGIHFLEEEGDDLVETVRRVADERGSTYIFVGTPDESRRREIFGGSLLSRMVREIPGIDIRVVADRALKERGRPTMSLPVRRSQACRRARATRARALHARQPRADGPRCGDPDRPSRGGDPRPRLPDPDPAPVRARRADEPGVRDGDTAARSRRARRLAGRRPRRRAHRERPHADPRPRAPLGRRALRPHRHPGARRTRARLHAQGAARGCSPMLRARRSSSVPIRRWSRTPLRSS